MKKLILVLLFSNLCLTLTAQVNVDSLFTIWNDTTQPDTNRLKAMDELCFKHYLYTDLDSAMFYGRQMLGFATDKGLKKYQANALHNMGTTQMTKENHTNGLEFFKRSLALREEIGDKKGIGRSLSNMAGVYQLQGDFINSLDHYNRALKYFKDIGDTGLISHVLINIGFIYMNMGNFPKASEYLSRSLRILEESGNSNFQVNIANTHSALAGMYWFINDFAKAKEYSERARSIYKKLNYISEESKILVHLGEILLKQGDFDGALAYCEEAISLNKKGDNIAMLIEVYRLRGKTYSSKGDYDNALAYIEKSYNLALSLDNNNRIFMSAISMGQVYLDKKEGKKAVKWCEEALSLVKGINQPTFEAEACKCLYESHKMLNNSPQALAYHERYIALSNNLQKDEAGKKLQQMEFSSQLLADSLAHVEKELITEMAHQEELHSKDQTRNMLLGSGLIVFLVAGGLWSRNRYIRKTNLQLKEAKERAESSEQFKQQFLANMSHEIRTPMHAISGMVKILKRNEHLPTQDTFLNAMQTSSDNLVVILNDVLDLSKIEAGKLDIENIPLSPTSVIENVTQILKYKAEEKGLQLNYQIDKNVPSLVIGDSTRLNQILLNLAGNAIKFTEKGSVDILLQKEKDQLRFTIKDTGIGIPKEKVESIFGAFEQAKDSTSRNYGGTGLGLSISKQLVELQQGKIWAESEEGKGSTFFVELPLVAAAANAVSENLITENRLKMMTDSLNGIRILLAEDNAFNQMIAQDDLSFFIKNVKIDAVKNGAMAVEKFKADEYDLILMDIQMPEMNGFEAALKIRTIEQSSGSEKRIPIIAMTASLLKSEIDNCYESGMDNYIPKPYKPEELIGAIYEEVK